MISGPRLDLRSVSPVTAVQGEQEQRCAHCGRSMGGELGGYASVGDDPLCHPNEPGRPDCYRLVTAFGHPLRGCVACAPYLGDKSSNEQEVAG